MRAFVAIPREPEFSPGKVDADRAIFDAVVAHLRAKYDVCVLEPGAEGPPPREQDIVLAMCQGPAALARLKRWQAGGTRVINSPEAIESCHRRRMVPALARAGVAQPETFLTVTGAAAAPPGWVGAGVWIKRGDVHATNDGDVVFVRDQRAAAGVLRDFARRGIRSAAVQRHVAGEVFKFYAVRGRFFAAFGECVVPGVEARPMLQLAAAGAAALGLDVYGGDCVRDRDGRHWLIDLNDWPSYARCRSAAAVAIAAHLGAVALNGTHPREVGRLQKEAR